MNKPLVLLIDSNALIHRAYHAYPKTLTTPNGELINAVYGFFSIILQVIIKNKPEEIYFAFDAKEKTFRHKLYKEYKGTRKKTDEELIMQFKVIKEILAEAKIHYLELDGYEADDIIGTLAKSKELQGKKKIIITGDGDLMQLIDDETYVFLSGSSFQKSVLYDSITAEKKLGYSVDQIIEYKGLRGDTSDNIPGVSGIGEVTAKKILSKYKTIDELFQNLENLPKPLKNKLSGGLDIALLSRELATLDTRSPVGFTNYNYKLRSIDFDGLRKAFVDKEFRSLISVLSRIEPVDRAQEKKSKESQLVFTNVDNNERVIAFENLRTVQEITSELNNYDYLVIVQKSPDQESCTNIDFGFRSKVFSTNIQSEEYRKLIDFIIENKVKVITYNSKYLHKLHLNNKLKIVPVYFDIRLAGYLLGGGSMKDDLNSLALKYLNEQLENISPLNILEVLNRLYLLLEGKLQDKSADTWSLLKLLNKVEIPLSLILAKMEIAGITLDVDYLKEVEIKISKSIEQYKVQIFKEVGYEFNLASPKQLGEVLFVKLNLPGKKKNKNGGFSTNEKVLQNLVKDFPIVKKILDYRELAKLKSTYTSTLVNQVDPVTGRIHSKFNQDVAATGRLSSTDPNLQNIPVSSDIGQEVRKAFVAGKGKKFVFFDYSQQELRLLAHLSEEENLIKAFQSNIDIHSLTASRLLDIPIEKVTKSQRRMGKTVNFGIVYGISAFGLSDRLQIDNAVGQKYIDGFFETYPKVRNYFNELVKSASESGYITTLMGRRKNTEVLRTLPFQAQRAMEREIINFPLQGSAADMVKVAMIKSQEIIDGEYKDFATLLLQIHDELVFEVVDDDEAKLLAFAEEIATTMLDVFHLKVKMKVDVEVGYNLSESSQLLIK